MNNLFTLNIDTLRQFSWRETFENLRSLRTLLIKVSLVTSGCINRESGIVTLVFAKKILLMKKKSGLLFTALYLKQCSVSLMKYYAATSKESRFLTSGPLIKLTRDGVPVIIPRHHRDLIKARGPRGDYLVKWYLSIFSVSKIILKAKPISKKTFSSITTPIADLPSVSQVLTDMVTNFQLLMSRYAPSYTTHPLNLGMTWSPVWKALPSSDASVNQYFKESAKKSKIRTSPQLVACAFGLPLIKRKHSSIFTSLKYDLSAFLENMEIVQNLDVMSSPGGLFPKSVLWPGEIAENDATLERSLDTFISCTKDELGLLVYNVKDIPVVLSRLSSSLEGSGKRRLFVIGNYIKQRLLLPIHDWTMDLLRSLPSDGTYDQAKPIKALLKRGSFHDVYSFDLSSATDRWPVTLIYIMIRCIFGDCAASTMIRGSLFQNTITTGSLTRPPRSFCFQAGQPLGYHGSWALFSLTHHYLVWMAASIALPGTKFKDYALLGDDIVINHKGVALQYREYLRKLQVDVSESKSINSPIGYFEFAKQFWNGPDNKNLSPVSARALLACKTIVGVVQLRQMYNLSLTTAIRLAGGTYRSMSKIRSKGLPLRFKRYLVIEKRPPIIKTDTESYPLELWLGQGLPLSPSVRGDLIRLCQKHFKPKDLELPPSEYYGLDDEHTFVEYTLVRQWMVSYLRSASAYYCLLMDPYRPLTGYFQIPIISHRYYRSTIEDDIKLQRWSLVYRLYNEAGRTRKSVPLLLPALPLSTVINCCWQDLVVRSGLKFK